MNGYKGMNQDMTCRGFKYEVGKTYRINGELKLCENGFHFCKKLSDVFGFYDRDESRFFRIKTGKNVKTDTHDIKSVTSEITILSELSKKEINRLFYNNNNHINLSFYNYSYYVAANSHINTNGCGNACGDGYGYGYSRGDGYRNGNGYGYMHGDGYHYSSDKSIYKILTFIN